VNGATQTPFGLAVDRQGNLFVADLDGNRVRKISAAGIITTVAGDGSEGFSGDGGPATDAKLRAPAAVAVDGNGNAFIADYNNSRVRKVSADGTITTYVGDGTRTSSGDGGPAGNARLIRALSLALDGLGNLYIADFAGIRKVSTSGIITTLAGGGSLFFNSSDGGPATSAALLALGVAVDSAGELFISELVGIGRIHKVTPERIITTVAGKGAWCCFSGDGGPAPARN
jgi:sugar lactone lactonase YvrE